jgi:4-hydroxy-tetrahydrodipicolinate synthase
MSTPSHQLSGVGTALVTPFTESGALDLDGFRRLLAHVGPHTDYWVLNGTTAESPTLEPAEVQALLACLHAENRWKRPVVLGIGGNNTAQLLDAIAHADFSGICAVLSSAPAYNKPSQEGYFQHYTKLADACPVPIILYNVPGRTASNVEAATTIRLSRHPNIIGIKEASGNLFQCLAIAKHAEPGFLLISGDDLLTVPIVSIGGHGAISVMSNAFPKQFCGYVRAALQGDYAEARRLVLQQLETNQLLFAEGNPTGVKAALALLGVCGPQVRLPLVPATESLVRQLREAMQGIDA